MLPKSVLPNRNFFGTTKYRTRLKQPKIVAKINKIWVQAIIDTGATISIISEGSVPENCPINTNGFMGVLRDVSANIEVVGTVKLNFEITKDVVLHHEFVVLNKKHLLPTNVILGTDILTKIQAVIDFSTSKLLGVYRGKSFSMKMFSGCRNNAMPAAECYQVHVHTGDKLHARSEMAYRAYTRAPNGEYGIGKNMIKPGCFVAESLVKVQDNTVYIKIINLSRKELFLDENAIISSLYNVANENIFCVNMSDKVELSKSEAVRLCHVPSIKGKEGSEEVLHILNRYRNVISIEGEKLGCANLLEAEINTGDAPPVFKKQFPLPHRHKQILKDLCKEMKEKGIIRTSNSEWNSPIFLVKKPNGQHRPVVDFRSVNAVTAPDPWPLPRIDDIFSSLNGSRLFSTIDLNNGYFQVNLKEGDRHKSAFTTDEGRYEFLKCPFGIRNAPNLFARLMNMALSDLLGSHCMVYIDDIIIHSKTLEEHLKKLDKILNRLGKWD